MALVATGFAPGFTAAIGGGGDIAATFGTATPRTARQLAAATLTQIFRLLCIDVAACTMRLFFAAADFAR